MSVDSLSLQMLKIPVSDIEKSVLFYRDVLGFKEEFVAEQYGWAQFSIGDLPLALYVPGLGGGNGQVGGSVGFHFKTDDLETLYADYQAKGANIPDGIFQGNDGSAGIDVYDPDGNIIKIMKAV